MKFYFAVLFVGIGTNAFSDIYERENFVVVTETFVENHKLQEKINDQGKPEVLFTLPRQGARVGPTWLMYYGSDEIGKVKFRVEDIFSVSTNTYRSGVGLRMKLAQKNAPFADFVDSRGYKVFVSGLRPADSFSDWQNGPGHVSDEQIENLFKAKKRLVGRTYTAKLTLIQDIEYHEVLETFTVPAGFERDAETIYAGAELDPYANNWWFKLEFKGIPELEGLAVVYKTIPSLQDLRARSNFKDCEFNFK